LVVAFLASAAAQLNDPDPAIWVAVYVVAALFSALGAWRCPLDRAMSFRVGAFGGICLVWGAVQVPRVVATSPPWDQVFSTMQMMAPGVEEAREGLGLWLIAGWMMALVVVGWRQRSRLPFGARSVNL
jgi:hypothetical protein